MKSIKFLTLLILTAFISCEKDEQEKDQFLLSLNSLDGVEASKFSAPQNFKAGYELNISQPLDHNNPGLSTFNQKVYIYHHSESAPVVFGPSGSTASSIDSAEVALALEANQIMVTHRYVEGSEPSKLNWDYLTIEQSAADHHKIVEKMKEVYEGPWISVGRKNNAFTALAHKRFYPDDVSAVIAYVTPFYNGIWDLRPQQYFKELSSDACYKKLEQIQLELLKRKDEIIVDFQNYLGTSRYEWNMGYEKIYELAVISYPSTFWQYHDSFCDLIPDTTATNEELFGHLIDYVSMERFSSEYITYYHPIVYQQLTEIGASGYQMEHLADYLDKVPVGSTDQNSYLETMAPAASITYHPEVNQDIYNWLVTQGNNIIYIYGEDDPFTACAIELTGETNALKLIQEGVNRGVKLKSLDQKNMVLTKIEEWMGETSE